MNNSSVQVIEVDDEMLQLAMEPRKKVKGDGFISFINRSKPIQPMSLKLISPWMKRQTKQIKDPLLRFHNEIIQFYDMISPTNQSHQKRLQLLQRIKNIIKEVLPNAQVKSFGSFNTKLYLPDSDMDIAVLTDDEDDELKHIYNKLYRHLRKYDNELKQIQYIAKAKVPIIKFINIEHNIHFDVSINKIDGIYQLEHVERANSLYPQFKYLMFVFKCTLKIRGMGQPFTGGIGSFLLFCMILVYLRQVHQRKKYYLLSEHVLRFMEFYSMGKMDRKTAYVASGYLADRERQPLTISIKSPQDQTHDVGRSAFNSREALKMFKNRYRFITNFNFGPNQSILKYLVNPSQSKFQYTSNQPNQSNKTKQ